MYGHLFSSDNDCELQNYLLNRGVPSDLPNPPNPTWIRHRFISQPLLIALSETDFPNHASEPSVSCPSMFNFFIHRPSTAKQASLLANRSTKINATDNFPVAADQRHMTITRLWQHIITGCNAPGPSAITIDCRQPQVQWRQSELGYGQ